MILYGSNHFEPAIAVLAERESRRAAIIYHTAFYRMNSASAIVLLVIL